MDKLLIVDDEEGLRRLVRATLESDDYEILEAADGQSAIDIARAEAPSVVLLDVGLPQRNGFEVCRTIKADPATSDSIVVMLTAYQQTSDRQRGVEAGADYYLTKPFSPIQLLDLINRIFQQRRTKAQ